MTWTAIRQVTCLIESSYSAFVHIISTTTQILSSTFNFNNVRNKAQLMFAKLLNAQFKRSSVLFSHSINIGDTITASNVTQAINFMAPLVPYTMISDAMLSHSVLMSGK